MLPVKFAVFAEFKFACRVLPVFLSCIIAAAALFTLQSDQLNISLFLLCHNHSPENLTIYSLLKKPPIGLEPMTPTLPWLYSTD